MPKIQSQTICGFFILCLMGLSQGVGQEPNLTEEEMRQFLLRAEVVQAKNTSKGLTSPWRLTLRDGKLTHDAAFQSVNESKEIMELHGDKTELQFRNSYHFNIAAYELAKMLGLDSMLPIAVERKWRGKTGSMVWWVPFRMDESTRLKKNIQPPDADDWNRQLNRMWVFSELIYDTGRNQTNILITQDWKLWTVDFTRAFRPWHELLEPKHLIMCDRQLMQALRDLKEADVLERTRPHLGEQEIKALMARRDKIVALIDTRIAQEGESAVLY